MYSCRPISATGRPSRRCSDSDFDFVINFAAESHVVQHHEPRDLRQDERGGHGEYAAVRQERLV